MKISIDIDCTPDEARRFLGLPDVAPLQKAVMKDLEKRMTENISKMDPDALFRFWFPGGLEGFEKMQRAFWQQMTSPRPRERDE